MKAKVGRGGGFRGALNYVFDESSAQRTAEKGGTGRPKEPELVGGTMSGRIARALAQEFGAVRKLRPDIERPVWHASLSCPPGERLAAEQWNEVAADFMQRMGFPEGTPYVAVRHQDTAHDHIHIVASRVNLGGEVWLGQWEAMKAIEATQQLEKAHGLTLTAGLGDAIAERRKSLTRGEEGMARRTGTKPPKMAIQDALDDVLQRVPMTALEFVQALAAHDVHAVPNVATTGTMNGFSFEFEGIPFKGSSLGTKGMYTWKGLKTKGVTYDVQRDFEGLANIKAASRAGADAGRADAPAPGTDRADQYGYEQPADRSSNRDIASIVEHRDVTTDDQQHGQSDRQACDRATGGNRRADGHARGGGEATARAGSGAADRSDQHHEYDAREDREIIQPSDREPGRHRAASGQDRGAGREAANGSFARDAEVVEVARGVDTGRSRGRISGGDWASRFKQAGAAKRRAANGELGQRDLEQGHAQRARVAETDRQSARELDPTAYLESVGYTVKKEGRHLSVRLGEDEHYRITIDHDGHYVACDLYGNDVGDNIALVRDIEPTIGFSEAVYRLSGSPTVGPRISPPSPPPRVPPKLPEFSDRDRANETQQETDIEQSQISDDDMDGPGLG